MTKAILRPEAPLFFDLSNQDVLVDAGQGQLNDLACQGITMPFDDELRLLEKQLQNEKENLLLIQERISAYPLATDVPLLLVKEEREHAKGIATLEARILDLREQMGGEHKDDGAATSHSTTEQSTAISPQKWWSRVPIPIWVALIGAMATLIGAILPALFPSGVARTPASTETPQALETQVIPTAMTVAQPSRETSQQIGYVTWTNPKDGAIYVQVEAGPFLMGNTEEQIQAVFDQCNMDYVCSLDWFKPEVPQQMIDLDGFWIMRSEVTNTQYGHCVDDGICSAPKNERWDDIRYNNHPVTHVNWHQALQYAQWAGGRLPSEAEWEKACRGTDGQSYAWGNQPKTIELANADNYVGDTSTIGSYPKGASPYHAWDMGGNVWEWTSSLYRIYPYQMDDGREDQEASGKRVMRGGAYSRIGLDTRCSYRINNVTELIAPDVGFRVARSSAP